MTGFFVEGLGAPAPAAAKLDWQAMLETSRRQPGPAWSAPEAFVAILFAAATCDGDLAREEQEELIALTHRSRALKTLSQAQLVEINRTIVERLAQDAKVALAQACAALPRDMRLSAFAHALDLVLADGALSPKEADFLNDIVAQLDLDQGDVERMATCLLAKNAY